MASLPSLACINQSNALVSLTVRIVVITATGLECGELD